MKILVIDDDQMVRYTLSKILRNAGNEVTLAEDGARGMAMLRTEHPDVVITDIIMPEQEGFETIAKIRQDYPDIKIMAISGGLRQGNLDVLSMAAALGADDVLSKPFELRDLLSRLSRLGVGTATSADSKP